MKDKLSFSKWNWYLLVPVWQLNFTHVHGFLWLGWVPFGLAGGLLHSFTHMVTTKDIRFS